MENNSDFSGDLSHFSDWIANTRYLSLKGKMAGKGASYMITTFVLVALAAAFIIGFLFGDNRAVRQANMLLGENWRELMQAIREDGLVQAEAEEQPTTPTLH